MQAGPDRLNLTGHALTPGKQRSSSRSWRAPDDAWGYFLAPDYMARTRRRMGYFLAPDYMVSSPRRGASREWGLNPHHVAHQMHAPPLGQQSL